MSDIHQLHSSHPVVHVTGLTGLSQLAGQLGQVDLLSLVSPGRADDEWRAMQCNRHVTLQFNDINAPRDDLIVPDQAVVQAVLDFGRQPSLLPLVVHCWAGISRSSAAAYIMACDRNAGFERDLAQELRRRAPFVTPNLLMVEIADQLLNRRGAMLAAASEIGRGADAFEGTPYTLPLIWTENSSAVQD